MRQSDYTKKTQELSQQRKQVELSEEEKNTLEWMKSNDFITKEDIQKEIANLKKQQEEEEKLKGIMQSNPDLLRFEPAIRKLGNQSNEAWEDIIVKNGFIESNKLKKAIS
jgi:hypothetical protein